LQHALLSSLFGRVYMLAQQHAHAKLVVPSA